MEEIWTLPRDSSSQLLRSAILESNTAMCCHVTRALEASTRGAESLGRGTIFHSSGPTQRQCVAAIQNTDFYELHGPHLEVVNQNHMFVYKEGYSDTLEAVDENNQVAVLQGPGLGMK